MFCGRQIILFIKIYLQLCQLLSDSSGIFHFPVPWEQRETPQLLQHDRKQTDSDHCLATRHYLAYDVEPRVLSSVCHRKKTLKETRTVLCAEIFRNDELVSRSKTNASQQNMPRRSVLEYMAPGRKGLRN